MSAVIHLRRLLPWACTPALILAAAAPSHPDPRNTGTPFVRVWTAEEYGASPVNWHILQHPGTGFIYAANNFGILEYDGAAWRLFELPGGGRVRTLVVDQRGRVWGAGDDIVRLEPDITGVSQAISQLDRLPPEERAVGNLLYSAALADSVAFGSQQTLYVFPEAAPPFVIPVAAGLSSLWVHRGELHATLRDGQVRRLEGQKLRPAAFSVGLASPASGMNRILAPSQPRADGSWDLLSNRGRLNLTANDDTARLAVPLPEEFSDDSQFLSGTQLTNGGFAAATARSGLILFDRSGRLIQRIDREQGLPGNRIDFMHEDAEGGLWLAMRTGLARVQVDSPFAVHGRAQGIEGGPRHLLRHNGRLFVCHNEGLAVAGDDGHFRDISGVLLGGNRVIALNGRLYVTSAALYELHADQSVQQHVRQPVIPLISSRTQPGLLLGGMSNGVWIIDATGDELKSIGRLTAIPGFTSHLLDTGDGYVWATTPTGGLWRIDFRDGIRSDAPVRAYGEADGLLPVRRRDEMLLFELGGKVVVGSAHCLLRHDRGTDRLVPETRIAGLDPLNVGPTDVSHDETGGVWLRLGLPGRELSRLEPVGPDRWEAVRLPIPALAGLISNGIYPDLAARTVWIAGQGALVSIALDWKPARPAPALQVFIRRVESDTGIALLDPNRPDRDRMLASDQRALHIAFAAPVFSPDYHGQTGTVYRTRLDGLDSAWSEWTSAPHRDFTNLPYRALTFRVQARDLAGRLSPETVFAFQIAPPWWLSGWAWTFYAVAGALLFLGLIQLRTRTLRTRNEHLESAVAARTRELHTQNLELARLHRLELDEKTSARLAEEKARLEVLRYQLNPHFLFNALNSVCAHIIREPVAARAMVVRLADFCRLTLHLPGAAEEAMTIAHQLRQLHANLEIEQARLGDLITVEIAADPAAEGVLIPPFLLLPLVENAVKYGSATSTEHLVVRLTVRRTGDGAVAIEVANTGQWLDPGAHSAPSHGIGLENLRQRLARYYPDAHEFTVSAADGWVSMRLRLSRPLTTTTLA